MCMTSYQIKKFLMRIFFATSQKYVDGNIWHSDIKLDFESPNILLYAACMLHYAKLKRKQRNYSVIHSVIKMSLHFYQAHTTKRKSEALWNLLNWQSSVFIVRPGIITDGCQSPFLCFSAQTGHQWCSIRRSVCLGVERHAVRLNVRRWWEQAISNLSNLLDVFQGSSKKGEWEKMSKCISCLKLYWQEVTWDVGVLVM